jgi:uncharacterized protein (TIGR03492 family)
MMDDLEPKNKLTRDQLPAHTATILLLPGSRPPEAYENWAFILEGITPLAVQGERLVFIAAIAPLIDIEQLKQPATALGWQVDEPFQSNLCLRLHYAHMLIVKQAFNDGLHLADLAIATAGTATEQCVGLGKPIITLPGNGPQFTWAFAEAQSRLLGPSIHLLTNRGAIAPTVLELTRHSQRQSFYQQNGRQRMGSAGAALRITQQLQLLFSSSRPLRKT